MSKFGTDVTHQKVLITGGATRIGAEITRALAAQGWSVAIHCRNSRKEADALAAAMISDGVQACVVSGDLSAEAEVLDLFDSATAQLGTIGAVINNASVFEYDNAQDADRAGWDKHLETNLRAPFVLAQQLANGLKSDERGAVINILDQRVWNLTPHFVSYTVSKSALWTLTQTLALGLAPKVRVNGVGPGPTLKSIHQSPDQFAAQQARMPLAKGPGPKDVADAVCYLLGARAVTGQMIAVDGGEHLGWGQVPVDAPIGRD